MTPPGLVVLTDRRQLPPGRTLLETVARCSTAGLTTVVLRELDLPEDRRQVLAAVLADHVQVISARSRLPAAVGVHLSSHQPPRARVGAGFHGRSCHDEDDVARAVGDGAAYVTVSPVAVSASKPGYGPALGLAGVRRAVAAAGGVPVLALGGVHPGNAADQVGAGAHGVAVMGAVMRASDPEGVVTRLLQETT